MTDILHSARKNDRQFLFEVKLNWLTAKKGILSANDVKDSLHVATSQKLGGDGREWSPEQLFLSSLSSCFMTTYLAFARKMGFGIIHFACDAIGQIEQVGATYQFTHINLFPKVYVSREDVGLAGQALQKTQKNCLVSNSIRAEIIYHSEVLTESETGNQGNGYTPLSRVS